MVTSKKQLKEIKKLPLKYTDTVVIVHALLKICYNYLGIFPGKQFFICYLTHSMLITVLFNFDRNVSGSLATSSFFLERQTEGYQIYLRDPSLQISLPILSEFNQIK